MIVLFTDFGWQGPYVGQMKAVLHQHAPNVPVVDLMHDVPAFNPRAGAHLLAATIAPFAEGSVFLCVVDPGVGDPRRVPVALWADGCWFVGPGNGLLDVVAARSEQTQWYRIDWRPSRLSDSFHGRDLFAVVAAELALARTDKLSPLSDAERPDADRAQGLAEIIYIDAYGNCMSGLPAGYCAPTARLRLNDTTLAYARTFSEAPAGSPFWYVNALGLIEIALNQGSAADMLSVQPGNAIRVEN